MVITEENFRSLLAIKESEDVKHLYYRFIDGEHKIFCYELTNEEICSCTVEFVGVGYGR